MAWLFFLKSSRAENDETKTALFRADTLPQKIIIKKMETA